MYLQLLEVSPSVLVDDKADLWKCAAIDLKSEEEDGTRWRGVWMDCATSVLSQPGDTELCATLQRVTWEANPKYRAAHHRRLEKQTLCGAVGFWASSELPIYCVGRLCFVRSCVFAFVLINLFL